VAREMSAPVDQKLNRRTVMTGAACLALTACEQSGGGEIKRLKSQVQDRFGAKDFAKAYELSVKGFMLAREKLGDKHADTLYFAQAVSENALQSRNLPAAQKALKIELELRSKAGQSEEKLQRRRTTLIKLAEESGDKTTAIAQTVLVAQAINMGSGKDPQPTYMPSDSPYTPELAKQRVEGDVEMSFNLDANGTPSAVRVTHAIPANVFDAAAVEYLKRWRFTPYLENGTPVSSTGHHYTLAFRMPRGERR
jgi:TonB family protein